VRITCPICGDRERREFYYQGHAALLERPAPDAGEDVWEAYLHLRDNPAGRTRDLWHHEAGCGAWVVVTRDTVTHQVYGVALARDVTGAGR
jgi:sarcosine oxidase subunit delta